MLAPETSIAVAEGPELPAGARRHQGRPRRQRSRTLPAYDPTGTLDGLTFADPEYWNGNEADWSRTFGRVARGYFDPTPGGPVARRGRPPPGSRKRSQCPRTATPDRPAISFPVGEGGSGRRSAETDGATPAGVFGEAEAGRHWASPERIRPVPDSAFAERASRAPHPPRLRRATFPYREGDAARRETPGRDRRGAPTWRPAVSSVHLKNIVKRFGDVTAVHRTSLEIRSGAFVTLLGPFWLRQDDDAADDRGPARPERGRDPHRRPAG